MRAENTACIIVLCVAGRATAGGLHATFLDVTSAKGLGGYLAQSGDGHGPGGVFTDLDGDGYADLYLLRAWGNANHLYLNVDDGRGGRVFARAAGDAGAGHPGNATGAIAGDYDNDGDLDLYVINFDQPNVLYRNDLVETGVLFFVDVTDAAGVGTAWWDGIPLDNSLTAAWGDPDRDGDLDLYVGNHNGYFANPVEGPFDTLPGRRDVCYRNEGYVDGHVTFTDVTETWNVPGYVTAGGGFETANQRYSSSNAVIFADFDNDRWPDLLVTNKIGGPDDRDMLYMNRGDDGEGGWLGFEMVTYDLSPVFGNRSGAAMGVDVGDPDHDGDLDIYITDWSSFDVLPPTPGGNDFWVNQLAETGELGFVHDLSMRAVYSWGTQWQDLDNDGDQDLHVAVQSPVRDYLYMNTGAGFVEQAEAAGIAQTGNGRGDMSADYDRDGWVDFVVVNLGSGTSLLYENRSDELHGPRSFLSIKLHGDPAAPTPLRSTRDAIGARVRVVADVDGDGVIEPADVQIREVISGSSNAASTSSLELEYGLGVATSADVEILWPGGRDSILRVVADQFLVIDEATLAAGDIDGDGEVGVDDLVAVILTWGPCPTAPGLCPTDISGDGAVAVDDLVAVISNWG